MQRDLVDIVDIKEVERKLNFCFSHPKLLLTALIHPSYKNEAALQEDNERLEFLGDAVLGLLVTEHLFLLFPSMDEGSLSTARAALVNATSCCNYTNQLGIGPHLLLGCGEKLLSARGQTSAYANLFEAILGAVYLDGGIAPVRQIVIPLLPSKSDILPLMLGNPKNRLQQFTQKNKETLPIYEATSIHLESGAKGYHVQVLVNGKIWGEGIATSKKEAEKLAAQQALNAYDNKN